MNGTFRKLCYLDRHGKLPYDPPEETLAIKSSRTCPDILAELAPGLISDSKSPTQNGFDKLGGKECGWELVETLPSVEHYRALPETLVNTPLMPTLIPPLNTPPTHTDEDWNAAVKAGA